MASEPVCAKWAPDNTSCKKTGKFTCKNCHLIAYCGPECQKSHWTIHKHDCKSPLREKTWQPDCVLKNEMPAFVVGDSPQQDHCGGYHYLWGNIPAFDVLNLGANEGDAYDKQLRLLFAASGDPRNVIKTIAQLPDSYNRAIDITINDIDFDVVARNVIILLISLVVDDINKSTECIIHVWYSALLRKSDLDILQQRIRPLIREVCDRLKGKPENTLLARDWTFGQRSLELELLKSAWDALLAFTESPKSITAEQANEIRKAVTLAECRKDRLDYYHFLQSGSHRVALTRFREDGLLLPFGAPRNEFYIPNPTLFRTGKSWPMDDLADPLDGWSPKEVHDTSNGPATADIYGKLYIHLHNLIRAFLHRLSGLQVSFQMLNVEASTLPKYLHSSSYSRIEVSNISDGEFLGIHRTLHSMVPLLQSSLVNPHATLITLFKNVKVWNLHDPQRLAQVLSNSALARRVTRLKQPNPMLMKFVFACRFATTDNDRNFDRLAAEIKFSETARLVGAAMKDHHTVIEKWPFRLKLEPGQPGAEEEFELLICSGWTGQECYLEWKRV